jgi:hypothetical protein
LIEMVTEVEATEVEATEVEGTEVEGIEVEGIEVEGIEVGVQEMKVGTRNLRAVVGTLWVMNWSAVASVEVQQLIQQNLRDSVGDSLQCGSLHLSYRNCSWKEEHAFGTCCIRSHNPERRQWR